ncbi:MAG: oligosaccharide flippase family protein [Muribaculaceae bacterium]|nr:oligosaccharide flippase family protein [Muribaculaceae bacterium]
MERVKGSGKPLSAMVLKALGLFGSVQMLNILLGIVRTKLVVVWLGAAGVGLFAIYNSVLTLVSTFSQMNLRTSAVREVAGAGSDTEASGMIYVVRRWSLWLGLLGLVAMAAAAPVFSIRTFGSLGETLPLMALGVAVLFMTLGNGEQVALQGRGLLKPLASSSMWGTVGGVALTVGLIWWLRDDGIVPSLVGGSVMTWLAVRWHTRRLPVPECGLSARETWEKGVPMVRLGLYMTLAYVMAELFNYIFITYLTHRGGVDGVGYFQAGFTIMNRYVGMVFMAIGVEFYPRLSTVVSSRRRTSIYVSHETLLLCVILLGGLTLLTPFIPLVIDILYSADFHVAEPMIYLGFPALVLRALTMCMSYVILARGDGKAYVVTEVISEAVLLGLNIWFYDMWGLGGLGVASIINFLAYLGIVSPWYFGKYGLTVARRVVMAVAGTFAAVLGAGVLALTVHPAAALAVAIPSVAISLRSLRRFLRK